MGDSNRKRKHGRWNPKVRQKSVEPGVTGLFFTCEGHEKQALNEAYSLIDEVLEKYAEVSIKTEDKTEDNGNESEEDLADALKKACDSERNEKPTKQRRCIQRPTGVKNCIFISVKDANISKLAEIIADLTQESPRCRFLQRVLPVEHTESVDLSKLNDIIMQVITENMKARDDGSLPTYSIEFKARNNDSISKSHVLEMVDDALRVTAPLAKANLSNADITFYIQISRTTMMIGTCRQFYKRRKFSTRSVKVGNC